VFVTGADEARRVVYCCDADSGVVLWEAEAPGTPASTAAPPKVGEATGYAASTPVTDGRHVYAIFANGDIAAVDFAGQVSWSRSLGMPKNTYGYATSLAMYRDLLLVQFDQGTKQDKLSKLLALKAQTGETAWETLREVPNSWPTPIVIEHQGQPQIITAADPWVIAYAPADGKEIWRAKCLQADVGPSPTFAGGTVFVANEFPGMAAIRPDGTGDVTDSHVLWEADMGSPDCCSPLATDQFLMVVASFGTMTCYNAKEGGEPLWEQDFDGANFSSSPSLAGKYVFLFEENGKADIVEPTEKKCVPVAENELGEECVTSPAFQEGRIYIRGKEHLFCLGEKAP
jgi:outer membrane protein assembly factor BamB